MYLHESGPGDGPTIIFLHGNGANGSMWSAHMQRLSDYHCLAPDFPGFGRSSGKEWISLDDTAEKIIALIDEHAVNGRTHIVGLSLGGSVAYTLMAKAPQKLDHIIVDGAGLLPLPGLPLMKLGFRLLQPFLKTEFVIRTVASSMRIPQDGYEEFKRNMRIMSSASFTHAFLQALSLRRPPGLEGVQTPVLLVAGQKEPAAVLESNRRLAQELLNARSVVAAGMGHGWYAEAPDLHYRMLHAWLEDRPLPDELIQQVIA